MDVTNTLYRTWEGRISMRGRMQRLVWASDGPRLGQRLRRWPNLEPTLPQICSLAGWSVTLSRLILQHIQLQRMRLRCSSPLKGLKKWISFYILLNKGSLKKINWLILDTLILWKTGTEVTRYIRLQSSGLTVFIGVAQHVTCFHLEMSRY